MDIICEAIRRKRVIEFVYDKHHRVVEPQILGKGKTGKMILSAWQVGGRADPNARSPWVEYQIVKMSGIVMREETFEGARPGYVKGGGKKFTRVFCELTEGVKPK